METNQCLRKQYFDDCLTKTPKGPDVTKYNDWDEVVDSCASTAYYMSLRKRSQIPESCQSGASR